MVMLQFCQASSKTVSFSERLILGCGLVWW